MPERYNQGQLASPVVGTPGLDRSAGQAELQIAQTADAMRTSQNQLAMQASQRAEQSFNSAYSSFHQWGAEKRYEARLQKATENEQRRQQVQYDLLDEGDLMTGRLDDLQARHGAAPTGAVKEFVDNIGVRRQEFMQRHADDPIKLRMLMPAYRASERGALNVLKQWSSSATTANLNKRLGLLPEELTGKVNGLKGTLPEQLLGFQQHLTATNSIYENMKNSAVTPADRDMIAAKQLGLQQGASKDFVNHVMAQVPDGEEGMKYLNTVAEKLKDPAASGLNLSPEDHKSFVEHVHSQRSAHEQEVIVGIQGNSTIAVLDANKLKANLYRAADDPKQMAQIAQQVWTRMGDLDKQVALVSKEPDSKIKNAKLAGLKQEQSAFIAETGIEMKQQRSFEQLQRSLTSFAQSQIRFQQSQIGFQQGQVKYNYYMADRVEKMDKKAADEQNHLRTDAFNKEWGSTLAGAQAAWAQPMGPKQQAAIHAIVNNAVPKLNAALAAGTIKPESYNSYMNQLKEQSTKVQLKKDVAPTTVGPFSWGGGVKTLTGSEKTKAIDAAQMQFGEIAKREQANFLHMQSGMEQLGALTTNKTEKAMLTRYISEHLPTMLNSKKFQSGTLAQQQADLARAIRTTVAQHRQGQLK